MGHSGGRVWLTTSTSKGGSMARKYKVKFRDLVPGDVFKYHSYSTHLRVFTNDGVYNMHQSNKGTFKWGSLHFRIATDEKITLDKFDPNQIVHRLQNQYPFD